MSLRNWSGTNGTTARKDYKIEVDDVSRFPALGMRGENVSTNHGGKKRVVVLGGGFAGVYAAMELETQLRSRHDFEICLVNKENYLVFQPMLPEVISGNIGILDTVSPLRRLLPNTRIFIREILGIDLKEKTVTLSPGFRPRSLVLEYDHLVVCLGNVTDFRGMPGLHEHAMPFKNLADALRLRDHLIRVLGEADIETDPDLRKQLLTFVVAGGGFSGVEVAAELNDFVRRVGRMYHKFDESEVRVILLHSHDRILDREFPEDLSLYAQNLLKKRGVEFWFHTRLVAASPDEAILNDGRKIQTKTLISTVPSSPNPLIDTLDLPKIKGRIKTDLTLQVDGYSDIWALGDCAAVPDPAGGSGFSPPTAQFAVRQGHTVGHNIVATIRGLPKKKFAFKELGKMSALGHRRAVAQLFGKINLQGFIAYVFWRTVYWMKLPGFDRKIKVGASWLLELFIQPELVQTNLDTPEGITHAHYEPGDIVFREGELGDRLYIILKGSAEVVSGTTNEVLAKLQSGEVFGEMAIMGNKARNATVRCVEAMDVLTIANKQFKPLADSLPYFRQSFEHLVEQRESERAAGVESE